MVIVSLGIIDKKLFLPLLYVIIKFSNSIYWHYHKYNIISLFIESFGYSISQIMTIFLRRAFKYTGIHKNKKAFTQSRFKDIFFLFLLELFYILSCLLEVLFESDEEEIDFSKELYINDAIEIIFITIVTYFILKYKYYKHHVISIVAFILFAVIIDILLGNFSNIDSFLVIASILYILVETLLYGYFKYLLEIKYYYFLDILLIDGIINISTYLITFIIIIFIPEIQDSKTIFKLFSEYYEELGIWSLVFQIILCTFIFGFLDSFLQSLILKELTPSYVIISYELSKIPISTFTNEGIKRWIVLIISVFQIISLLFYLEILECNFCSLNKNTKKSISQREQRTEEDNDEDNEIIYKGYDITEIINKPNETNIELEEKNITMIIKSKIFLIFNIAISSSILVIYNVI